MLRHPLLNALFNEHSSVPSKQLQQVRQTVFSSTENPGIVLICPPAAQLRSKISAETLLHDDYLLSHVAVVLPGSKLVSLDAVSSELRVQGTQLVSITHPEQPPARIIKRYLWQPGLENLDFSATFMVLEIDGAILGSTSVKNGSWFNHRRSTPLNLEYTFAPNNTGAASDMEPNLGSKIASSSPNLASALPSPNVSPRKHKTAKIDYCLACMQMDAISGEELAERFYAVVCKVQTLLDTESRINGHNLSAYNRDLAFEYAEQKLAKPILGQLDIFLSDKLSLGAIQKELRYLDIGQVDIPNLQNSNASSFERAILSSAEILARLHEAEDSRQIGRVLLASLSALTRRELGTVSADTLIGMFMLTMLRTSPEATEVIERQLFYLNNFSPPQSGQLAYVSMLSESVVHQLKLERQRLQKVSECNYKMWRAVRDNDKETIMEIYTECPSSLLARKNGKSIIFLAVEDHNKDMLSFLLSKFPDSFNKKFLMSDKDMQNKTLLMSSLGSIETTQLLLEKVDDEYFDCLDLNSNNVGHYLLLVPLENIQTFLPRLQSLNWCKRNIHGDTPLTQLAKRGHLGTAVSLMRNFYDHIDVDGNSLLHHAVLQNNAELVSLILTNETTSVDYLNLHGESALKLSLENDEITSILLNNGANPWVPMPKKLNRYVRHARVPFGPYVQCRKNSEDVIVFHNSIEVETKDLSNDNEPSSSDIEPKKDVYLSDTIISIEDFKSLVKYLSKNFPYSWIPSLQDPLILHNPSQFDVSTLQVPDKIQFPSIQNENTEKSHTKKNSTESISIQEGIGKLFSKDISVDDGTRLMFFLRMISQHGTFPSAVNSFITRTPFEQHSQIELHGGESMQSILAFFQIGREQLGSLNSALRSMIKSLARLTETEEEYSYTTEQKNLFLADYASALNMRLATPAEPIIRSTIWRFIQMNLILTSKSITSLQRSLEKPTALVNQLRGTEKLLAEFKIRHDQLFKRRHSWLPSLEDKRAAEIATMELDIKKLETQVASLREMLGLSHFYLATELSAFNATQETEIMNQIKIFSQFKLKTAKTDLKNLENSYKLSVDELN